MSSFSTAAEKVSPSEGPELMSTATNTLRPPIGMLLNRPVKPHLFKETDQAPSLMKVSDPEPWKPEGPPSPHSLILEISSEFCRLPRFFT